MIRNIYARVLALMLSVTLTAALPLPVQAETPSVVTAEASASSSGGKTKQSSAAKKSKKKSKKDTESGKTTTAEMNAAENKKETEAAVKSKSSKKDKKTEETTASKKSKKTEETTASKKSKKTEETTASKKSKKTEETTASKKSKKTKGTTASKTDKKTKETTASKKDKKTKETTASKTDKKAKETTASEKDKKTEETAAPKTSEKETTAEKEAEPSTEGKQDTDAESSGEQTQEGGEKSGKEEAPAPEEGNAEKPAESSADSSEGENPADSTEGNKEETTAPKEPEETPSKEETAAEKETSQAPEKENETKAPESEKETKAPENKKETKAPEESSAEPEAEPVKKDVNGKEKTPVKESSGEKETTADPMQTDLSLEAVTDPETAANEPKAERISESEEAKSRREPYAEQAIDEITGDLEWIEDEQGNVRLEPAAEDTMGILFQIPLVTTFIEPTFIRDFRFRHVDGIPASLPEDEEIYAAQDVRSKVVGKVIRGKALVNIIEKGEEWSFVEAGYVRGFVKTSDLKEEKNLKPDIDLETAVGKGALPGMVEEVVDHLENPAFNYTLTTAMDVAAEKNPALTAMSASIYDRPEAALLDVPEPTEEQKDQLQQLLKSSSKVVGTLKTGDLAYILADLEDGKVVFVESGNVRGFVNVQKLTTGKEAQKQLTGRNPDMLPTAEEVLKWEENRALYYTITSIQEPNDAVRQEVVAFALQFVGNPYVWGGTDLINGTDCSGFVMRVYEHFGYRLPRTSYYQRGAGEEIKTLKDAKLGDLILYNGHVALYIGNGQIVHASNHHAYPVGGIKVSRASVKPIIAIRRIIPD